MDLSGQELHVVAFLSSAKDTLDRANSLISLAETNRKEAGTLAACATVILATALEQGVKTKFSEAAQNSAVEDDVHVSETKASEYDDSTIWWRVQQLPSVLSGGEFRLLHNHNSTIALRELIRTRNSLVHVAEPALHLIGPSDQIKVEEDGIRVTFFQPLNPWRRVKLEQAKTFQQAIEAYFGEVLFPESGTIKAGSIIARR